MDRKRYPRPTPERIERLQQEARRYGCDLPSAMATAVVRKVGADGRDIRRVADLARLIKAAQNLGESMTWRTASQRLGRAGGCVEEAIFRLDSPLLCQKRRASRLAMEIVSDAAAAGFDIPPRTATNWLDRYGEDRTREIVASVGRLLALSEQLSTPRSWKGITQRLLGKGWTEDQFATYLYETRRRREERWARACKLRAIPADRRLALEAFASCGCGRCEERAWPLTRPMRRLMAQQFRSSLSIDDVDEVGIEALSVALDIWPGEGEFFSYYNACLRPRLMTRAGERADEAREVASLDEPTTGDSGGRVLTIADRVHDGRSIDPARVVIWREQLSEAITAWRDSRAARADEYERELVPA